MFNELIKDILKEAFFKNLDISTDIKFQKCLNLMKNSNKILDDDKKILIDRLNASYKNCKGNAHSIKMLLDASKFIYQYTLVNNNQFIIRQELQEMFARDSKY